MASILEWKRRTRIWDHIKSNLRSIFGKPLATYHFLTWTSPFSSSNTLIPPNFVTDFSLVRQWFKTRQQNVRAIALCLRQRRWTRKLSLNKIPNSLRVSCFRVAFQIVFPSPLSLDTMVNVPVVQVQQMMNGSATSTPKGKIQSTFALETITVTSTIRKFNASTSANCKQPSSTKQPQWQNCPTSRNLRPSWSRFSKEDSRNRW